MYRKAFVLGFPFNRVGDYQACNFIKKRLEQRCFTVNFAKLLKVSFLQNSSDEFF